MKMCFFFRKVVERKDAKLLVIMVFKNSFCSSLNFIIPLEASETQRDEEQNGGSKKSLWSLQFG